MPFARGLRPSGAALRLHAAGKACGDHPLGQRSLFGRPRKALADRPSHVPRLLSKVRRRLVVARKLLFLGFAQQLLRQDQGVGGLCPDLSIQSRAQGLLGLNQARRRADRTAGRSEHSGQDHDDEGSVATTDNNGDGDITEADQVDPDDEDTWYQEPPAPAEDASGFHHHVVAPGAWSTAFTNPFLVDRGGDGWTAPGLSAQVEEVSP